MSVKKSGPPDKSELLAVSNFNSPQALQQQIDTLAQQGYTGPTFTFTMNGSEYVYVGGYYS